MGVWHGLEVSGRKILTIGAGGSVNGTISALLDAGARVRVVAEGPGPAIEDLARRGRIELINDYADVLLDDVALVIISGTPGRQDAVLRAAADRGVLVCPLQPSDPGDRRSRVGEVVLVGGGPGDPGLLTVAGLAEIKDADVIAADRLAPLTALEHARPDAEIIDVGKIPRGPGAEQRTIEGLLIERAKSGRKVVRFKGGDNFVFGRGGEEWQ
ncbi:MAG TPA: SAM-dependent methyltransferase, partial [Microlunatus sp.]